MMTMMMPRLGCRAHGLLAALILPLLASAALAQEPTARAAADVPTLSRACPAMAQVLDDELAAPAARAGERAVLTVDLQLDRAGVKTLSVQGGSLSDRQAVWRAMTQVDCPGAPAQPLAYRLEIGFNAPPQEPEPFRMALIASEARP